MAGQRSRYRTTTGVRIPLQREDGVEFSPAARRIEPGWNRFARPGLCERDALQAACLQSYRPTSSASHGGRGRRVSRRSPGRDVGAFSFSQPVAPGRVGTGRSDPRAASCAGQFVSTQPGSAPRRSLPKPFSFGVSHSLRTVDECIGLFSRTRKQTIAPDAIFCALLKDRDSRLRHRLLERHRGSLSARIFLFGRRTVSVPDTWPLIFLLRTDLPTGTSGPPLTTSTRCSTNSAPTRSTL